MQGPPRRVLIRGVNWLGDAVMTTPALQRVRQALPQAHLTLLTPAKLLDLWSDHPSLDAVESFSPADTLWSVAAKLRAGNFDTALVLPNSARSALEAWLARIEHRIGYARSGRGWLLTQPVPLPRNYGAMRKRSAGEIKHLTQTAGGSPDASSPAQGAVHHIHHYLRLAAALGADPSPVPPSLTVTSGEVEQARAQLLPASVSSATMVLGLNPGAEYGPAKRWPAEKFAAVVRAVTPQLGACVWLAFGAAADRQLCEEIVRLTDGNVLNLAGKTSLRQLMALLKLCRVVLTNDTGPMHLAAALGTSVVVPFGSTSPELTAPGLPGDPRHRLLKSTVPCSPCFRRECPIDFRCMNEIRVERVSAAIRELLSRPPDATR